MEQKIENIVSKNPFLSLLAQLSSGRVVTDCAEKYPQLIEAVKRTGKKGEFTLKLTIKPDGKGEVESVEIHDEVKVKTPDRDRKPTTFFVMEDNTLTRTDPKQTEIKFPHPEPVAASAGKK